MTSALLYQYLGMLTTAIIASSFIVCSIVQAKSVLTRFGYSIVSFGFMCISYNLWLNAETLSNLP